MGWVTDLRNAGWVDDVRGALVRANVEVPSKPGWPDPEMIHSRTKLLSDDIVEFADALNSRDLERTANATVFVIHRAMALGLVCGLDLEASWLKIKQGKI